MSDPVSWLVIEPGWSVTASDGSEVGSVSEVVGDSGADIFDGLAIKTGPLSKPRYVPAERVARIVEGRVELELSREEVEGLEAYEEPPPQETILPPDRNSERGGIADVFRRLFGRRS